MIMAGRDVTKDRLRDLERTIHALDGQLRDMQWELQQTRGTSMKDRLWSNLIGWQGGMFMSAVCNRRIRPNTKVVHNGNVNTRY